MLNFESFTVERFRGLHGLQLEGLGRINLLVGPNNSGKTSLLESLACYCNPLDGFFWMETALRRSSRTFRSSRLQALRWLFPQSSDSTPLRLSEKSSILLQGTGEYPVTTCKAILEELEVIRPRRRPGMSPRRRALEMGSAPAEEAVAVRGAEFLLKIDRRNGLATSEAGKLQRQLTLWDDQPLFRRNIGDSIHLPQASVIASRMMPDEVSADDFSAFRKLGLYSEAIEIMRQLDPGVREVLVLSEDRGAGQIYVEHAVSGLTPLSSMGDGLRRALEIAITIPKVRDGVLLVDEIESALHVSALTRVFELLVESCKAYNVQLFATTHSLEALDAILGSTLQNNDRDLVFFRLENAAQKTNAVRLDEKTLATVRNELGQEVR